VIRQPLQVPSVHERFAFDGGLQTGDRAVDSRTVIAAASSAGCAVAWVRIVVFEELATNSSVRNEPF